MPEQGVFTNAQQAQDHPPELSDFETIYSDAHQEAPYDEFLATATHQFFTGKVPAPIAASPSFSLDSLPFGPEGVELCKVVKLHMPVVYRIVEWTAIRTGVKPKVPKPVSTAYAELMTGSLRQIVPPPNTTAETGRFGISGVYVYVLKRLNGRLPVGGSPVLNVNPREFEFVEADFARELLAGVV